MTAERRLRLLSLAIARKDRLAIATLTGNRRYTPDEPDYTILGGLRWIRLAAA